MKNVNLEIKRMLSLLESQLGDVKPLISEQLDFDEKKVSYKVLKMVKIMRPKKARAGSGRTDNLIKKLRHP